MNSLLVNFGTGGDLYTNERAERLHEGKNKNICNKVSINIRLIIYSEWLTTQYIYISIIILSTYSAIMRGGFFLFLFVRM